MSDADHDNPDGAHPDPPNQSENASTEEEEPGIDVSTSARQCPETLLSLLIDVVTSNMSVTNLVGVLRYIIIIKLLLN